MRSKIVFIAFAPTGVTSALPLHLRAFGRTVEGNAAARSSEYTRSSVLTQDVCTLLKCDGSQADG